MNARCPKCKEPIDLYAAKCETCGEDFTQPLPKDVSLEKSFDAILVYGAVGNIALKVGQFTSMLSVVLSLIAMGDAFLDRAWLAALVFYPLSTLTLLAIYIALRRVEDIGP